MATTEQIRRWERRSFADRLAGRHFSRAKRLHGGTPDGYWSGAQWLRLLADFEYRCAYCGRQFPLEDLTPDHVLPLARGGVNAIRNLVPACKSCNSRKGAKTAAEYMGDLARDELIARLEAA